MAFNFFSSKGQDLSFPLKSKLLIAILNSKHCNPPPNNSQISNEILDLFINDLDNGLLLKESDVQAIKKNRDRLFEEIELGKINICTNAKSIFLKAANCTDSLLSIISSKPINFNNNDTITFYSYSSKPYYSTSLQFHKKRLERLIKFKVLEKISQLFIDTTLSESVFHQKANEAFKNIIASLKKNIKQEISKCSDKTETSLLNAICLRYDPHSNYFSYSQKSEFDKQLSSTTESFGFKLKQNENNEIVISYLEPGGSAWLSNSVNEGDILVSLKLGPNVIHNDDFDVHDIEKMLDYSQEKSVIINIKKSNGSLKSVYLIKQKVKVEENNVTGYIFKDHSVKVGYISLPSFYTNVGEELPGCANDVAKEILKLDKDTIQGLILDLRNNGGGSMQEAINLAGIFIDEGPLFIHKEKGRKPTLIKDYNRGSIFKKKLIVLINEASASASELFANIIKDYNAGIIVGQKSYGKGTSQVILPLDSSLETSKALDFIKLTTGKFYRLNTSTHQGNGVEPDLVLPGFTSFSEYKENKEMYYIKPDSVVKKVLFYPFKSLPLSKLQSRSERRVKESICFKNLKKVNDSLQLVTQTPIRVNLNYKDFKKYTLQNELAYNLVENALLLDKNKFNCFNNTFDKKLNEISPEVQTFNDKLITRIEKDIYLNEAFEILTDYINLDTQ